MPDDLRTFSGTIGGYGVTITKNINSLVKTVSNAVVAEVVLGTPVDTGAARSNWLASIDEDDTNIVPPHSPGRHLGTSEVANYTEAVRQAESVIATRESGQAVIIQNNLDYMQLLNDGSSKQAPANFIESAIQVGVGKIQNAQVLVSPTAVV